MRILYVANVRMPTEKAHGVQIVKMCEAFAEQGNDVTLLVPWRFNPVKEDPHVYYGVKRNFRILKVPSIDLVKLGRMGFWVQSLTFAICAALWVLCMRRDLVYGRDELTLLVLSFLTSGLAWEVHMPRRNLLARTLSHRVSMVAISQGLKDFYTSAGVRGDRILVAHDGVDADLFLKRVSSAEVRRTLGLPQGKPMVMYIGLLDPWKGAQVLLEASRDIPEAQVVMVGEGKQFEAFKRDYPQVIFTGFLPYRDLAYNQQAADVLVVPNSGKSKVSALYTSPLKVFAHMASGVPLVASRLPALCEVLSEDNAYLIPPDDPKAMAKAIEEIINDPARAQERAQRAREEVLRYTWACRAEKILYFLKQT